MKKSLILLLAGMVLSTVKINAQQQIIDLLNGGLKDANLIANEYLRPYGEMLGVNLNSGWYNSAKVHKLGGFDLTVTGSYTTAPKSRESFDAAALAPSLETFTPQSQYGPTMAGSKDDFIVFEHRQTQEQIRLDGAGLNYFVSPMLQAAVGLPFHTEVMGRFMPRVEFGDYGKAYMWGLGLKHSLKEYIPFMKRIPFLQMSVLGAYTHFEGALGLNDNPYGTGNLESSADAYTGRLLLGANFPVVAIYTGVGYGNTRSNFDVVGQFTVENQEVTRPITTNYATDNFDFNVGMRLRLAIFSIHADYRVGDYSVISGGVGINFR